MHILRGRSGLWFEILSHGGVHRCGRGDDMLCLFVGSEVEAAPASLWLRRQRADGVDLLPLLGPASASRLHFGEDRFGAAGAAAGLQWQIELVLAQDAPAWFWRVEVCNTGDAVQTLELVWLQDVALAPYGALRLNEHYVSHYIDLAPLAHRERGWVVAARQNLAVGGRHPWALFGSLQRAASFATDALQVQGRGARSGAQPAGLVQGLPARRLQHEHSTVALQDAPVVLAPGERAALGFFGHCVPDHPAASSEADLALVEATLALPEATRPLAPPAGPGQAPAATLFSQRPMLDALDLGDGELAARYGAPRRHEERDGDTLLAFFCGDACHVVLRAKEAQVLRPHGHILRTGAQLVPDESALTSTTWMAGVFHSMVTQGHVSINRFLSTVHGYLGQFRSHGLRLFVDLGDGWQQLGVPSAFEIEPEGCRWVYRHRDGLFTVRSRALDAPQRLALDIDVAQGAPLRWLVSQHLALAGDDGSAGGPAQIGRLEGGGLFVAPPPGSDLARRFPGGGFVVEPAPGTRFERVGGDELLYIDGRSRAQPFLCIEIGAAPHFGLSLNGRFVEPFPAAAAAPLPRLRLRAPPDGALAGGIAQLDEIVPWFVHNALVHYLAPRGLEQYSGGGWGTRDVCQGPLEMLLALGRTAPARDLLLRTYAAQNADGDWPQWFMFFERDRANRAGDSHGDIVFWPLLGLARYLAASGDAAMLDEVLPFHDAEPAPLWQHVQRALAVIDSRRIAGTRLVAYGHGDWNDALQPADPALREHLCSAWTVTLHHQMLVALAQALRGIGRDADAAPLDAEAGRVQADFRRWLLVDGVVTGYALFAEEGTPPGLLLHPSDRKTGLRYSLLPMMHAVLENLLSPAEARQQLALIAEHLLGPDGARLFDAPLAYRGGPERIFQRAESSAYFGREIGLMYTHAHLRYAQALAHVGDAEGFFAALLRAQPLGLGDRVAGAAPRQANCYYSSSDAAFADRYEASREYARVRAGTVALEGGWRVYSSGPGIALGVLWRQLVGMSCGHDEVTLDPVLPSALDGLRAELVLFDREFDLLYRVGRAGCGPAAVTLNGQALAFVRRANPYRLGAAAVPRALFESACRAGRNALVIEIG